MDLRSVRNAALTTAAAMAFALAAPAHAPAQVSVGVNIGAAPVCPYGYYGYYPYNCAPYGYYGPEWFANGMFIGAGPWFHGPRGFYGHVNHDFDPRYGYHGSYPAHNEHFDAHRNFSDFHGNDYHGPNGEGHHEGFHEGGHNEGVHDGGHH